MKNIEDVIKAYECKKSIKNRCNECPYITECDDKYHCECEARDNDTLHYLKEYRDDRENFSEAISNCGKALNKYIMDIHALAQQEENLPLTWDELRTMEGKPVWVGLNSRNTWGLIDGFYVDALGYEIVMIKVPHNSLDEFNNSWHLSKEQMGTTWQAYRKERE